MPSQSLQEIVANLLTAGIPLRRELAPYNIPIAPPTQHVAQPTNPTPTVAVAALVNSQPNDSHNLKSQTKDDQPQTAKKVEKPKQTEKKTNDRSEKKPIPEQKPSEKSQQAEKKVTKAPSAQSQPSLTSVPAPEKVPSSCLYSPLPHSSSIRKRKQ
jgi:hypothetical protein